MEIEPAFELITPPALRRAGCSRRPAPPDRPARPAWPGRRQGRRELEAAQPLRHERTRGRECPGRGKAGTVWGRADGPLARQRHWPTPGVVIILWIRPPSLQRDHGHRRLHGGRFHPAQRTPHGRSRRRSRGNHRWSGGRQGEKVSELISTPVVTAVRRRSSLPAGSRARLAWGQCGERWQTFLISISDPSGLRISPSGSQRSQRLSRSLRHGRARPVGRQRAPTGTRREAGGALA